MRNIWIYQIENNLLDQLTFNGGQRPLWSPDGTEITFLSSNALWTVPSNFSGTPTRLPGTEVAGNQGPGAWSPDGAVLLFDSTEGIHAWQRENTPDDASGTAEVIVGPPVGINALFPDFSPDGRWFVYVSGEAGNPELYVNPYPVGVGGLQRITTDRGFVPVWVRNGQELIFAVPLGGPFQSLGITTEPTLVRSNPVQLFVRPGTLGPVAQSGRRNYDVSSDGQRFIMVLSGAADSVAATEQSLQINIILNWFEELKERVPVP